MKIKTLRVGDTFENTAFNLSKVISVDNGMCTVETIYNGSEYEYNIYSVIQRINSGTYTNFTPCLPENFTVDVKGDIEGYIDICKKYNIKHKKHWQCSPTLLV